jgi:alkylhydroperoxidase/carboxymuconolactone decarboxylase family protein YurZ
MRKSPVSGIFSSGIAKDDGAPPAGREVVKTTWISIEALQKRLGVRVAGTSVAFTWLNYATTSRNALSDRSRALLTLAICIAARLADRVSDHVQDALEAGASRQEILEVIEIATLMGGDRSIRHAAEAVSMLEEHEVA